MSIVATVKVYDGIVLGSESMTSLTQGIGGQQRLVKAYENAQKLFQVGDLPVGVLTYGAGNIGRRSIESFVREFSRAEKDLSKNATVEQPHLVNVEQIARRFHVFMQRSYSEGYGILPIEEQPTMGFVIAGYSDSEHLASEWEFVLPIHPEPQLVRPQMEIGASWRGVSAPFSRLMFGIDPGYEDVLLEDGATAEEIERLRRAVQGGATQIAFDGMPLQDAIGCCKFIIQTTISWCTYALGIATCGGPIKLATITSNGFEWVTRPKTYIEGENHAAVHHH
jgi:hypothetical protein